jgi:hypothetical protein
MRYCYNCNHATSGEPLFCNACGRSFNVKLCPRLHVNPRSAAVCAQCGSRDLSTPQPRVPLGTKLLLFLLSLVPGFGLTILSLLVLGLLVRGLLQQPQMLVALILLGMAVGVLGGIWMQVPLWFRKGVYRMLGRKREQRRREE